MPVSTIPTANTVTKYQARLAREYVRGGRFGPYIGPDENKIIQTTNDLQTMSLPLVAKLSGPGVTGSGQLVNAEESLSTFAYTMTPTYKRNGVTITNEEGEKSAFRLIGEARPTLTNWVMELKRNEIIQAMGAIEAGGVYYNYGGSVGATNSTAASAANMDTWNTNNTDRILYGSEIANYDSGNHTTSLGGIDTTNDKVDVDTISLLKRMAENADPLIRPIMINEDEPWFVYFCGSFAFRDLRADLTTNHQNAGPRSLENNPLFAGGDLVTEGVIIKRVPEIDSLFMGSNVTTGPFGAVWGANATGDSLATGGASSSRVAPGFFCGAQAVGFGIGRLAQFKIRREDDYQHLSGVGVSCKHDIKKTFYNNKQHGMITHFASSTGDT